MEKNYLRTSLNKTRDVEELDFCGTSLSCKWEEILIQFITKVVVADLAFATTV